MRFDIIKRNQISLYAITLIIIGLLISNATAAIIQTTAQNSRNEEELNLLNQRLKELPQIQMKKEFVSSQKMKVMFKRIIETGKIGLNTDLFLNSDRSLPLDYQVDAFHPAMADARDDEVLLGYEFEYHNMSDPEEDYKTIIWYGSNDDGGNFSDGVYWINSTTQDPLNTTYPDADYWGENNTNNVFFATNVPDPLYSSDLFLMKVEGDPVETDSYSGYSFDLSSAGSEITAVRIACDDSQNFWEFGVIGVVIDGAPYFFYADPDNPSNGWYTGYQIDNCRTVGCAIDGEDVTGGYPIYIAHDLRYQGNDSILLTFDFFEDWSGTGGYILWFGPNIMLRKPTIAASEGHFVMLTEFWIYDDINMTYDKDIVSWHYNYSNPNHVADVDLNIDWVGGTIWNETTPSIQHLQGMKYIATFVRNNTLYACATWDGGVNWSDPINISGNDFVLTDDEDNGDERFKSFKNADIAEWRIYDPSHYCSSLIIWAYDNALKVTGTIRMHFLRFGHSCIWSCGDFNCPDNPPTGGDGVVNIADLTFLIAYLYGGGLAPILMCTADLNNDDIINIGDLTYLIAYLYGGGPPPNPDCCNPEW